MKMDSQKANSLNYSEIQVGAIYSFERTLTRDDVKNFAQLTGDFNPLHFDPESARKSQFKSNIVHGMLAGSLFSTLLGMHCPGRNSVYLSQTLQFRKPIYPGDPLTIQGTVVSKSDSTRIVTIKTEILTENQVAVTGEAKTLLPEEA